MSKFSVKRDIQNQHDLDALQKGRCPWCLKKLTPVFDQKAEHVADKCGRCRDTFAP